LPLLINQEADHLAENKFGETAEKQGGGVPTIWLWTTQERRAQNHITQSNPDELGRNYPPPCFFLPPFLAAAPRRVKKHSTPLYSNRKTKEIRKE